MIHSSFYCPRVFPFKGTAASTEIDRIQDLSGTTTLNRTKIEEVGREGIAGWRDSAPTISLSLRQLEYNNIEFYQQLANKALSTTKVELSDFKNSQVDIAGYKTDDDGTFLSTIWYPNLRLSGFGMSIGDPDALLERSFTLVGEDDITLKNNNKYFICKNFSGTTGSNQTYTIDDPDPVLDPDNSAQFLFKVIRTRAGATTKLAHGTEWSFDGTNTLTVNGANYASDTLKVYYSATTYTSGETPFVVNDSDSLGITADSVDIYLVDTASSVTRLQSVGIDVTFDRFDVKEIGNKDVSARGVRDTTVGITLGRILDTWTIEEALRGVGGLDFGKIDVRKFEDKLTLIVKAYTNNSKSTFALGYKFTDLAPVGIDAGVPINDFVSRGTSLSGETGAITALESDL